MKLSKESEDRVVSARQMVDDIVKENRVVYGITTGFGKFARTVIEPDSLRALQDNLIRSHAAGVGRALTPDKTRMLLALRINVLAKGYSGIQLKTLKQLIDAFNGNIFFALKFITSMIFFPSPQPPAFRGSRNRAQLALAAILPLCPIWPWA